MHHTAAVEQHACLDSQVLAAKHSLSAEKLRLAGVENEAEGPLAAYQMLLLEQADRSCFRVLADVECLRVGIVRLVGTAIEAVETLPVRHVEAAGCCEHLDSAVAAGTSVVSAQDSVQAGMETECQSGLAAVHYSHFGSSAGLHILPQTHSWLAAGCDEVAR